MKKIIFTFYILLSSVVCFSQDSERSWFTGVTLNIDNDSSDEENMGDLHSIERVNNCFIQFYGGKQILKRLDLGFLTEFSRGYFLYNSDPVTIEDLSYFDLISWHDFDSPEELRMVERENNLSYALSLRYHLVVGKKIGLDITLNPGMQTRFSQREVYEIELNEFNEEVAVLKEYKSNNTLHFFRSTLGLNYNVNAHWRIRFVKDLVVYNEDSFIDFQLDSNAPYFILEYRF